MVAEIYLTKQNEFMNSRKILGCVLWIAFKKKVQIAGDCYPDRNRECILELLLNCKTFTATTRSGCVGIIKIKSLTI